MINIQNVTKEYGSITVVDHLNLEISHGEFFGLLGPNGAGKTTTIRMISTLTPLTSGSIWIDGKNMDRNLSDVKIKIGVVPQYNNLEGEMTAWENLELHGRLYNMPKAIRRKRIAELLEFTELTERAHDLAKKFSGGMKRKLMIAKNLMHNPTILLLDEPTVGLDPVARKKMWDLLKVLKTKGLTVLLTTHYIEEAEVLCDRVGLMNGGKLVELDTPEKLKAKVGACVLEYFAKGVTQSEFFATRKDALNRAASIEGNVNIRSSNLEDVFYQINKQECK